MENNTTTTITDHPVSSKKKRIFYMDNIRIYLTVLVILHHLAVGYGGSGGWAIYENDFNTVDDITKIAFTLFNAINQSYFMAFFFILAGYFTIRSFEKKGTENFLKDRFIRLGIPLLIYGIFVSPLVNFFVRNFAYYVYLPQDFVDGPPSIIDIFQYNFDNLIIGVDHLWFLQALLLFAVIYVLYRSLISQNKFKDFYNDSFPNDKVLIASIAFLAIITFVVRMFYPVDTEFLNFQLGHFTHYAFCFWIGLLAYNGKWFDNLSGSQAKRWIGVALVMLVLLPIVLVVLVDFDNPNFDLFKGGLTLEAIIYTVWESITLIAISIGLTYLFRTKMNRSNKVLKSMSGGAYTAYIIHAIVILIIMTILIPVSLPAIMKFFIGALVGIPLIFILSHYIRQIPYFSRVL
ncbi:MAG: acyltransferase family protein [Candidatus Hodarchaeales archaeon]